MTEAEKAYHTQEATRIKGELNNLDSRMFASDSIVKTVLRSRIKQEESRAKGNKDD